MKAKKLSTIYGKHSNIVTYEYRGMQYDVEYANDWTYCITSPKVQHEDAQARIDETLDNPKPQREYRYEDTAEYGFKLFWDYVNG